MTDRISVIGLGKLGTPMLAVFAAAGFEVVGVDTDENAVTAINQGIAPDGVVEPGLQKLLTKYRANYRATVDIYEAVKSTDATFVIVPTPTGDDGGFVLDYIEPVARDIGRTLAQKDAWHLVVITSTVMPGQTHEIAAMIEQESGKRCGDGFGLCYSPEFIALGSVVHDFQYPDYALIGCEDDRAGDALEAIYRCVHENPKGAPIVRMN